MAIRLYKHQQEALEKLKTGSILVGGVGSGKSLVAVSYYFTQEVTKNLYIITTAKKRDTKEWEKEYNSFSNINPIIDSWNNLYKYIDVKDAFFIFDEQRLVGNGVWVKSFLKITKANNWILLSATPGDTWMDYIPIFLAHRLYKNRTDFIRRHVVYNTFTKFPKVDRYVDTRILHRFRDSIIVDMDYKKRTISHEESISVAFDKELFNTILLKRWNIYEQRPIKDVGELCHLMRKVVNSDPRRIDTVSQLLKKHPRAIIFYNFNYELHLLLELGKKIDIPTAQWNGHKHESIPNTERWMYLVQYTAGAEGWNCIETNVIIFYSQNYSYKINVQAAGRIDRLNTPFIDLYYYRLVSTSIIDLSIQKAIKNKRNFNECRFIKV